MTTNGNGATAEQNPPRLCHVKKVDTFDGYGFNLHAEHGKPGQYIGKVDEGSPAETAGLKEGDRILEVNGISIANDNHKQVVLKIKGVPNETKLLVVTPGPGEKVPGLNTTTTNGTAVTNNKTEEKSKETTNNNSNKTEATAISDKAETKKIEEEKPKNGVSSMNSVKDKENSTNVTNNNNDNPTDKMNKLNISGLTVAEMREKLAQRKKVDPKKSQMDLKQKFEIVKKL